MKLCKWVELDKEFCELDKSLPCKVAVIVFNPKESKWTSQLEYSILSRSYIFNSGCKYFDSSMGGSSIFADCLDGSDQCLKLSNYMGSWKSDYCIIFDNKEEITEFKNDPMNVVNRLYNKNKNESNSEVFDGE